MRRLVLISAVVLILSAADASAHCKRCDYDSMGCLSCLDTDYNAYVLCQLQDVGGGWSACVMDGDCEGPLGDPCIDGGHCEDNEDLATLTLPEKEWQLVSVKIVRPERQRS